MSENTKKGIYWMGYVVIWLALSRVYSVVQSVWEARMLADGLAAIWWVINLLYFIVDLSILVFFVFFGQKKNWSTVPTTFPFRLIVPDLVMSMALLHLAKLLLDHPVYVALDALGLGVLPLVITLVGVAWLFVCVFRVRATNTLRIS